RRLKNYLSREVAKRAQAKAILRPQVPDTRVVSSDDAYIARVTAQTPPGQNGPAATVHDVAIMELERAGLTGISAALPPPAGGGRGGGGGGRGGGRGGGGGTVVAALREHVAHVVVENGLVAGVTYIPSRNSSRWSGDAVERARLDKLHAAVATAARYGVFRIESDGGSRTQAATRLGDQIRVLKGVDPTLGLYAAYAYSDAGAIAQVRSVRELMRGDL